MEVRVLSSGWKTLCSDRTALRASPAQRHPHLPAPFLGPLTCGAAGVSVQLNRALPPGLSEQGLRHSTHAVPSVCVRDMDAADTRRPLGAGPRSPPGPPSRAASQSPDGRRLCRGAGRRQEGGCRAGGQSPQELPCWPSCSVQKPERGGPCGALWREGAWHHCGFWCVLLGGRFKAQSLLGVCKASPLPPPCRAPPRPRNADRQMTSGSPSLAPGPPAWEPGLAAAAHRKPVKGR